MPATERLDYERNFHDRQASQRAETFCRNPRALCFSVDDYLDHETWIRPAFSRLGDLTGKCVLDYGCGHGMAAVVLAGRGARVTGFDLSAAYVREAALRARANDVLAIFVQADAHRLPFADGCFDAIWGNAILHHLDLDVAGREIRRVLRPGGIAVFCEPWGGNPLLRWARRHVPYRGKERTPDEQPLKADDLARLRENFPDLKWEGFQLFSMVRRTVRLPAVIAGLEHCDRLLLRRAPFLKKWCRYMVMTLRR